jgi:hypothetical protein
MRIHHDLEQGLHLEHVGSVVDELDVRHQRYLTGLHRGLGAEPVSGL